MEEETVASLMCICIEGPLVSDFDFVKAARRWLRGKNGHTAKLSKRCQRAEWTVHFSSFWNKLKKRKLLTLCNISFLINIQYMQISFIVMQIRYPVVFECWLKPCSTWCYRPMANRFLFIYLFIFFFSWQTLGKASSFDSSPNCGQPTNQEVLHWTTWCSGENLE